LYLGEIYLTPEERRRIQVEIDKLDVMADAKSPSWWDVSKPLVIVAVWIALCLIVCLI